jgi:hypothetical protein
MSIESHDKSNFDSNTAKLLKVVKNFIMSKANKIYVHKQTTLSKIWTVQHNFGYVPSIDIIDSSGTIWLANITHIDLNTAIIEFGHDMVGDAICK